MTASAPAAEAEPRVGRLLLLLAKRDILVRTSGTWLGGAWTLLQPALQVGLFWYLLGVVLRVQSSGPVSFASYFITGMLPWLLLSDAAARSMSVLREFGVLFKRSVFPVEVLPVLPILTAAASYGLVFIVIAGFLEGPRAMAGAAAFTALLCLWLLPACYLLSLLGLLVRDAVHAAPVALSLLLYSTPILYHPDMVPAWLRPWLALNPVADLMAINHALLQGMPATGGNLLRPAAVWLLLAAAAWNIFNRARPHIRELL